MVAATETQSAPPSLRLWSCVLKSEAVLALALDSVRHTDILKIFIVLWDVAARKVALAGVDRASLGDPRMSETKVYDSTGGVAWIKKSCLLISILIAFCVCDSLSSRLFAQQKKDGFPTFINLEFALQAPDFDDTVGVERHEVFSIILASLLANASDHALSDLCTVSALANFPDLNIRIWIKEKPSGDQDELKRKNALSNCVRMIETALTEAVIERDAFDLAVQRAEQDHRPKVLESGDLNLPQWSIYRLPIIGRAALAELYRSDITVSALLDVYSKIESMRDAYPDFTAWLDRQRQSHRMGFYDLNERTVGEMRQLVTLESTASKRPVLKRTLPPADELRVDVPANVRGRPSILVRCAKERGRTCASDFGQVVCNKEIQQLVSSLKPEADHSQFTTRCSVISLLGIGAWIVVECDSESWLRKLWDCLATARMGGTSDFDWSLVEYAVWIETE